MCCLTIGGCASNGRLDDSRARYAPQTYVVQPHDTLYTIAWQHNLDYRELAKWNNIATDFRLAIGQVLVLHPTGRPVAPPAASGPAPAIAASSAPSTPPPATTPRVGKPIPLGDTPSAAMSATGPASVAAPATVAGPSSVALPSAGVAPSNSGAAPGSTSPKLIAPMGDAAVSSVGGVKWVWPTDRLSAPRPVPGGGILLLGRLGQDVRAAGSGRVVYTGSGLRGYGNLIIIKHGESLLSSYAHNRELLVHEGQDVAMGQVIAHMGTGPHQVCALYFEIRVNGKPTDPLRYLAADR
jgi:lipoprotein NlpD